MNEKKPTTRHKHAARGKRPLRRQTSVNGEARHDQAGLKGTSAARVTLPGLSARRDVIEFLGTLWDRTDLEARTDLPAHEVALALRRHLGAAHGGWEAPRLQAARTALDA